MTTSIPAERLAWLDTITLDSGGHERYEDGVCAEEAVAYLAGLDITDSPACASPVLRTFCISLNDTWSTEQRQQLKPYLVRQIGTAGDGQDEARSYLALDWLIRTYTPAWLDLAGLTAEAQALRDLRRIVDLVSAQAAGPVVRQGSTAADAAWAAAWAAAGDAAWAAARAALKPTVDLLQASALDLLDRMIDPSAVTQ